MEKLEKISQNLAKFIKFFYARKPEISPLLFAEYMKKKKLKKKVTLSIWGIKKNSQFYEVSKKFANNNAKTQKIVVQIRYMRKT